MSLTAVILIIISAFMHATWNLISKRQQASMAFFSIAALTAALLASPMLLLYRHSLSQIPTSFWFLLPATGIAQAVYFYGLTAAYRHGDISLVYPLARAIPILMVVAVSVALGQGDTITFAALVGMLLVVTGCVILPLPSFKQWHVKHYVNIIYLFVLVTAIGTTGYTLLDDEILRQLRQEPAILLTNTEVTLLFIPFQAGSTGILMILASLLFRPEREQLKRTVGARSLLWSAVLTGIFIMSTYGLVLASMAYVTNVSYVAAFRQLSIPIGALSGILLLKEPRYKPKLLGLLIISTGLILVGIG